MLFQNAFFVLSLWHAICFFNDSNELEHKKQHEEGQKMRRTARKIFVVLMVFSIVGFGGYAFAGQETYGSPYGGWGHHGPGWHHGEYGYMMGNLSAEEIQKMDVQREAFFKSTEDLRQQLHQKRLALESEFAKKNPDAKNAVNLQKEISDLKAQIDQKRIEYLLEMKKINPNSGTEWMGSGRMGYGYGRGYRGNGPMGYGSIGHPCWQ
jgi:zinc resistance-associated protein